MTQAVRDSAGARRVRGAGGPPRGNDSPDSTRTPYQNRADRRNPLRATPFQTPPRLSGLDQIIGLALGSPEFQRR